MKTTKHNLNAIALGVALAMGSLPMMAEAAFDNPPEVENPAEFGVKAIYAAEIAPGTTRPSFNKNELTGLCLVESMVSLLAARTNDFGCDTKEYTFSLASTSPGVASLAIGDGVDEGGTTLNAELGPRKDLGWRCKVDQAPGVNKLGKVEVVEYAADHGWSRTQEIFNSEADIILKDPQTQSVNKYRERDIKDFFKRVEGGKAWEFDYGLEDIKKLRVRPFEFYYPVQKWAELSWYTHENGQHGGLWVKKGLAIPRSANGCQIRVEADDVFNGSGEFEASGVVRVGFGNID